MMNKNENGSCNKPIGSETSWTRPKPTSRTFKRQFWGDPNLSDDDARLRYQAKRQEFKEAQNRLDRLDHSIRQWRTERTRMVSHRDAVQSELENLERQQKEVLRAEQARFLAQPKTADAEVDHPCHGDETQDDCKTAARERALQRLQEKGGQFLVESETVVELARLRQHKITIESATLVRDYEVIDERFLANGSYHLKISGEVVLAPEFIQKILSGPGPSDETPPRTGNPHNSVIIEPPSDVSSGRENDVEPTSDQTAEVLQWFPSSLPISRDLGDWRVWIFYIVHFFTAALYCGTLAALCCGFDSNSTGFANWLDKFSTLLWGSGLLTWFVFLASGLASKVLSWADILVPYSYHYGEIVLTIQFGFFLPFLGAILASVVWQYVVTDLLSLNLSWSALPTAISFGVLSGWIAYGSQMEGWVLLDSLGVATVVTIGVATIGVINLRHTDERRK